MPTLWALVRKDIRLCWRSWAGYCVGCCVVSWVVTWRMASLQGDAGGRPYVASAIFLYFAVLSASWLVERERSRDTFALLRALPVSDFHIVASKFAAYGLLQAAAFAVALTASPMSRHSLTGVQLASVFVGMALFGAITLTTSLWFADRRALAGPMVLWFGGILATLQLAESPGVLSRLVRWWSDPLMHAVAWSGSALLIVALVWLSHKRMQTQDTDDLIR